MGKSAGHGFGRLENMAKSSKIWRCEWGKNKTKKNDDWEKPRLITRYLPLGEPSMALKNVGKKNGSTHSRIRTHVSSSFLGELF